MSVPSEPQIYIAPGVFNQAIEFYWQPPLSDGGSNITSYILESSNIGYISILSPNDRKARVANLINQTNYVFTLKATNDFGNSNVATYRSVQPGIAPERPSNLNVSIDFANLEPLLNFLLYPPDTTNSSNITYNALTMYPLDNTGNIINNSPFMFERYYLPGQFDPVTLNDINTNYDYKGLIQVVNDVRWSKYDTFYNFKINPNLPTGNLKLWLDPYDTTSLTISNSKVVQWNDKSLNGSNALVNQNFAPTYDSANALLSFNGLQYMNLPINTIPSDNSQYTMFIYGSASNIALANLWLLYSGTPTANLSLGAKINNGNIMQSWFGTDISSNLANFTAITNLPFLSEFTYDGTTRRTYVNGSLIHSEIANNRSSTIANNIIASNSLYNSNLIGSIGDIIIYDKILTNKERILIENYLINKRSDLSLRNYGNLNLWLDANDNNTLYNSNIIDKISYHNPVQVWLDKSKNNNHAFQSNLDIAPIKKSTIFAKDYLNFNSSYMISNIATLPFDAFLIVQLNNLSNINDVIGISPENNNYNSLSYNVSANKWSNDSTSNTFISSNVETSTGFIMMEYSLANNNAYIRRNGSNIASITNFNWSLPNNSRLYIGNDNGITFNNSLKGNIGEIMMFNRQLIDNERYPIEGYLAWKWGIQSSLPSSHLFYNNAPSLFNISSGSSAPSVFTPTNINGLALWLDADDSTTLTLSGNNVIQWNDKSGASVTNNVTAPASTNIPNGSYNYFVLFVYGGYGTVGLKNLTFYGAGGALTPQTYTVANVTTASQLSQLASTDNFYRSNGSTLLTKRVSTASAIGSTFTNTTPGFPINNSGDSNFLDFLPFYISTPITPTSVSFGCYDPNSGGGDGLYRCKYFRLYGGTSTNGEMPTYLYNLAQYGDPNWVEADNAGYANFAQRTITIPTSPIPTYNRNILNSKPVVNFTIGQYLQTSNLNPSTTFTTSGTDTTIFLITRLNGDGINNLTSFGLDTTDNNFVLRSPWSTGNKILDIGSRLDFNYNLNNQIVLFSLGRNGTNMFLYNNGSLIGSISNASLSSTVTTLTQKLLIGSGKANGYDGYIAEFLIYKTALSTINRQTVEGYLAWKWGLQSNLPSDHPFKNVSPSNTSTTTRSLIASDISGLYLWIDANDSSTVTLSTTNTISTLRDKSANSFIFTGGSGFTYNITKFNTSYPSFYNSSYGSSNQLGSSTINLNQPFTAFYVGILNTGPYGYFHDSTSGSNRVAFHMTNGEVFAGGTINGTNITNNNFIVTVNYNTTSSNAYLNGSTSAYGSGSVGTNNIVSLLLGNRFSLSESWTGHICELLYYNGTLSLDNRQKIEGYLAYKWGLQSNLPSNHPYKNSAPIVITSITPISNYVSPSDYSPWLWFDASDTSSISLSGSNVTSIQNKGSSSTSLTPTTAGQVTYNSTYTINGSNLITVNRDYALKMTNTRLNWNGNCIMLVFKHIQGTAPNSYTYFFKSGQFQPQVGFDNNYIEWGVNSIGYPLRTYSSPSLSSNTNHIVCFNVGGSNTSLNTLTLNGTSYTLDLSSTSTGDLTVDWYLCNSYGQSLSGPTIGIAEQIIFSRELNIKERQEMEGYLAWKWNLVQNLPVDHPYKVVRPTVLSYYTFEFLPQNYTSRYWTNTGNTGNFGSYYRLIPYNSITTSSDSYSTILNFNGSNQYMQIPAKLAFNFSKNEGFTFICVAKFNSLSGTYVRFFDFANGAGQYNIIFNKYQTTDADFNIFNNGSSFGSVQTTTGYIDSNWHIYGCSISFSSNTTNLKIFRDNINSNWADKNIAGIPESRTTSINYIGRSNWSDPYFNGNIRYINFFNSNLSSTDLANLLSSLRTTYGIA